MNTEDRNTIGYKHKKFHTPCIGCELGLYLDPKGYHHDKGAKHNRTFKCVVGSVPYESEPTKPATWVDAVTWIVLSVVIGGGGFYLAHIIKGYM